MNNWSDELIKFKIAAYPGRIYYGDIDKKKIDEIHLDLYELYGSSDVEDMERKAIDFTRRVLERRISYYCRQSLEYFLERSREPLINSFFYATMANPRNLGYLLFYLYEDSLIYHRRINVASVREAARKYYEEKIDSYFGLNKFAQETFAEKSSVFSLKELLDAIVSRARDLKFYRDSKMFSMIPGQPPTSHFHISTEYEPLLDSLELNFFVTKFYRQKDRDGRPVTVYCLNYGLCQIHRIAFGRPRGQREFRLYYVERVFDYNSILQEFMKTNQQIVCDSCGSEVEPSLLPMLVAYDMLCPQCKRGHCQVINLSRQYENLLHEVNESLLLPRTELGILHSLETGRKPMFAAEIAGEMDTSYQLIGKRGKSLSERGLVRRDKDKTGRRQFRITEQAERIYFPGDKRS
jgi:hypothetical protein